MEFINKQVLLRVPKTTKRLLDLGCGNGWLGREVKRNISCYAAGITISQDEAAYASEYLDEVYIDDLNNFDFSKLGEFDCIVCSHILEHLYQPEKVLLKLHNNLLPGGILIVALPNILYWRQRLEFIKGRFRYSEGGNVLDRGHLHFFDLQGAHDILCRNGYKVIEFIAEGHLPLSFMRKVFRHKFSSWLDSAAVRHFPGLFGFQFILTASLGRQKFR